MMSPRVVIVQGVAAFGRLPRRANVEPVRDADVYMLIGAFRDAVANDGKVLFLIRSGRVRVDKGSFAWLQIAVADDATFHFSRRHFAPIKICFQIAISS